MLFVFLQANRLDSKLAYHSFKVKAMKYLITFYSRLISVTIAFYFLYIFLNGSRLE